jgi:hypothetical protein
MPTDRPGQPAVHPAGRANDRFRRAIGQNAGAPGRIVFDDGLDALPMRVRVAVVDAVRGYSFSTEDGEQDALRETAIVAVQGVAYRFRIVREPGDDDAEHGARLLIIGRA